MQHVQMIVTGLPVGAPSDGHAGYVAGRYRDGALSDTWTDVARCARGTFIGYVPACTCGWTGTIQPATPGGFQISQRELRTAHIGQVSRTPRRTARFNPVATRAGLGAAV
jgi:hypothetical protein